MAAARHYQLPRSIFLGRPWPLPGQSLWLDDDRDWAIEYEEYLASICGRCNTRHADWDKPDAFVAVHERCPGAEALAISDEEIPEKERDRGAYSVLIPVDVAYWRDEFKEAAENLSLPRTPSEPAG